MGETLPIAVGDRVYVRREGRIVIGTVERLRGRFLFVRLADGGLAVRPYNFDGAMA